ncbi:MAG: hypothetical protein ABIJ16_06120 [Bacteroidota bacterium]
MKHLIFAISLISVLGVNAQNDSLTTDSCKCKNEISLNMIPIFSEITLGDVEYQKFSITYKRRSNNGALRFQAFYLPEYSYSVYTTPSDYNYANTYSANDTVKNIFFRNMESYCFGGNIGYEWEKEKKWSERVLGFDVSFGINMMKYKTWVSEFTPDTNGYFTKEITTQNSSVDTKIMRFGINPFYGWKIKLENQFLLYIQFGPDFGYYTGYKALPNSDFELEKYEINGFYLSYYFVNEVSVAFRF